VSSTNRSKLAISLPLLFSIVVCHPDDFLFKSSECHLLHKKKKHLAHAHVKCKCSVLTEIDGHQERVLAADNIKLRLSSNLLLLTWRRNHLTRLWGLLVALLLLLVVLLLLVIRLLLLLTVASILLLLLLLLLLVLLLLRIRLSVRVVGPTGGRDRSSIRIVGCVLSIVGLLLALLLALLIILLLLLTLLLVPVGIALVWGTITRLLLLLSCILLLQGGMVELTLLGNVGWNVRHCFFAKSVSVGENVCVDLREKKER
jgi:hypothetical protein